VHRHNLLQLMLAHEASATGLAVALHAHNVERDRMRRRRLMLADALVPLLPALRAPVHGIWGREDVLFRHRLEVVERGMRLAPGLRSLRFIDGAGHWVAFERAEAFNVALLQGPAEGRTGRLRPRCRPAQPAPPTYATAAPPRRLSMTHTADVLVVGAGIAGASLAGWLAPQARHGAGARGAARLARHRALRGAVHGQLRARRRCARSRRPAGPSSTRRRRALPSTRCCRRAAR
jgi:hypothetical protein